MKLSTKILITVVAVAALAVSAVSFVNNKSLINLIFKFIRTESVTISNIKLKSNDRFIVVSDRDPVVIITNDNKITIGVTRLNELITMDRYINNYKFARFSFELKDYVVGGKNLAGIERLNVLEGKNAREIKILLNPSLLLDISIIQDSNFVANMKFVEDYLSNGVEWIDLGRR